MINASELVEFNHKGRPEALKVASKPRPPPLACDECEEDEQVTQGTRSSTRIYRLDLPLPSFQVPNVKLRPAQPSSSSSSKRSNDPPHQSSSGLRHLVPHSSQDDEPENTFVDLCPRPFKGIVLCATGIQDKVV